jgi:hypothetical protein
MDEVKKPAEIKKPAGEKKEAKKEVTYIMKVTHLSWGKDSKNHFFAEKKPLISEKEMGKYAPILAIWLKQGWIEQGSYK